jgi:hypothetical protein
MFEENYYEGNMPVGCQRGRHSGGSKILGIWRKISLKREYQASEKNYHVQDIQKLNIYK